jgi:c-di-GMP-binding flagellar brake protein YcgR
MVTSKGGMMGTEGNILQEQFNVGESFLIPIGTRVELELDGVMAKLKSFCVGALPEDCLIFKYPSITGLGLETNKLFEGNKITVRYVDRGNVFAFQSELLGFVTAPVKLIFVTYPTTIVRHSLRKVQRVECPLFAEVDVSRERFEGLIKDISVSGCRLSIITQSASEVLPNIEVGQMLSIHCALSGIEAPTIITGQVKSVQREGNRITLGTSFHDIDLEVLDRLASFISGIQKAP